MTRRPPRIGFHAPLKHPGHPVPSGDRTIARLLLAALQEAGFETAVLSAISSFNRDGDPALQARIEAEAAGERERLAAVLSGGAPPVDLWFTYHNYHKAPDLLGPGVAAALGIPYVVAEGSRSPRQAAGPWARGHALAAEGLDRADLLVVLNPRDRPALEAALRPGQRLLDLPPFIDPRSAAAPERADGASLRLLTVAMMREGDKLASYAVLAEALALVGSGWTLDVVGDGPARGRVAALLAPFGDRVRFHGLVEDADALAGFYARADLLAWPAVNEALGMVFLEAAAGGCPAVAGGAGGVASVVADGVSGLVAAPGDPAAFAAALRRLIADRALLRRLGAGARAGVEVRHSVGAAAARLRTALGALMPGRVEAA